MPSTAEYEAFLEDRKSKLTLQNTNPYDDLMSGRTSQLTVDDVDALERVLLFLAGLSPIQGRNEATKALLRVLDPTALAMLEASEPPPSPAPKRPPLRLIKGDNDPDQA